MKVSDLAEWVAWVRKFEHRVWATQAKAEQAIRRMAKTKGYSVRRRPLKNGDVELTFNKKGVT